jgi:hypothetical protein
MKLQKIAVIAGITGLLIASTTASIHYGSIKVREDGIAYIASSCTNQTGTTMAVDTATKIYDGRQRDVQLGTAPRVLLITPEVCDALIEKYT